MSDHRSRNGVYHQVYLLSWGSLVGITRLKRAHYPPCSADTPDLSPAVSHAVVRDGDESHGDECVAKAPRVSQRDGDCSIRALSALIRKPERSFTLQVRDAILLGKLTRRAVLSGVFVRSLVELVAEPNVVSPLDQCRRHPPTCDEKSAAVFRRSTSVYQHCQVGRPVSAKPCAPGPGVGWGGPAGEQYQSCTTTRLP